MQELEREFHINCRSGDVGRYCILPGDPGRCGSCFHVIWNQEREAAGLDQTMSKDTSAAVRVGVEALKRVIAADRG